MTKKKKKKNEYHGNDRRNEELHHLYEIYDDQKQDTFKYGIGLQEIPNEGKIGKAEVDFPITQQPIAF